MKILSKLLLFVVILSSCEDTAQRSDLKLWYDEPAAKWVEAETMAWSEGVKVQFETEWEGDFDWARGKKIADRTYAAFINNGDFIKVQGVDFGPGANQIEVSASPVYGGVIEVRIDSVDGEVIATVDINPAHKSGIWETYEAAVKKVSGVHDVYFVFEGDKDLFHFDWWQFTRK